MLVLIILIAVAVCLGIGLAKVLYTPKKPMAVNEFVIIGVVLGLAYLASLIF